MTDLDSRVSEILADPLAPVRGAANPLGYVGFDIPEDILAATGRPYAHLPWRIGPTPRADRWMESAFEPFAKSLLEQWAEGAFDGFGEIVFSRANDNVQRLYYYITELQRRGQIGGPRPLIFDVTLIPRDSSAKRSVAAVRSLAEQLAIDAAQLAEGIAIANRRRTFFDRLAAQRAGSGVRYDRIARASLFAPLDHLEIALTAPRSGKRILLAGSSPPDERLHAGIEAAGATVVGEYYDRALARLGPPVTEEGDPFEAIAAHVHAGHAGRRGFADSAQALLDACRRARAEAVVLWLIEEEEAIVWHAPGQRAALEAAGIPVLSLARRAWDGSDDPLGDIQTWLEAGR